jgi:hypothetical protein
MFSTFEVMNLNGERVLHSQDVKGRRAMTLLTEKEVMKQEYSSKEFLEALEGKPGETTEYFFTNMAWDVILEPAPEEENEIIYYATYGSDEEFKTFSFGNSIDWSRLDRLLPTPFHIGAARGGNGSVVYVCGGQTMKDKFLFLWEFSVCQAGITNVLLKKDYNEISLLLGDANYSGFDGKHLWMNIEDVKLTLETEEGSGKITAYIQDHTGTTAISSDHELNIANLVYYMLKK